MQFHNDNHASHSFHSSSYYRVYCARYAYRRVIKGKTVKTVQTEFNHTLEELSQLGITAFLVDGALKLRGVKEAITAEIIAKVTQDKASIIRYLETITEHATEQESEHLISELDVFRLLPTGNYTRDQYLKALDQVKSTNTGE